MDAKWKVHSSNIVYDDFLKIRKDIIENKDGILLSHSSLVLPNNAAVILAQDKSGRYILNCEYRHSTELFLLGCPGGLLEEGEDPIEGGKRELLEETGYAAKEIFLTGCAYPFPGVCNQKIYYLWAKDVEKIQEPTLDPLETIQTRLKTEEELLKAIRTMPNVDAILCTALWYKSMHMPK